MTEEMKEAYIEEVNYQKKMLKRLKKWMNILMVFSSLCLFVAIFFASYSFTLKVIAIVLMVISVLSCIIIGWVIKNGRENILKIIERLDKQKCL